jgi:hypothetical protein
VYEHPPAILVCSQHSAFKQQVKKRIQEFFLHFF